MGLLDTMTATAQNVVDQQPKTLYGTVTEYYNGTVTVTTDTGVFENIKCVNLPKIGTACLLVPVGDEYNCIPNEVDDTAMIYALGLGKFHIDDNGHLIYETAINGTNIFSINNEGHLIVDLDESYADKFKINDEGVLTYEL